jgi:GrpB-like predicted nucleotidyltransferase (UPF0157 family)
MRCLACGAESILVNVVQDDTMAVPGFEHHTFMCSVCPDTERRLVFNKPEPASEREPTPVHAAPSIVPTAGVPDEAAAGLFRRVLAKLRK